MKTVIKIGLRISIILSFLMATVCVFPSQALAGLWTPGGEMRGQLPGDCSGDARVTGDEVQEAKDTFLNPTPDNLPCRDFNADGLFSIDELMLVINSFSGIDRDGDGMLDSWEVVHGLDPSRNDANEDPDGDGFTNLKEFHARTDPQDSTSLPSGTVKGIITDASTGDPVEAATIMTDGLSATTDSNGEYTFTNLPAGPLTVNAGKSGYKSSSQTVTISAGAMVTADFALTPLIGEEEAIQILIDEVIKPDSIDHNLIAFTLHEYLKPGDEVVPYYSPESMHVAQSEEWFFWIDDELLAQYAHRTRYVYIDGVTGNVTVSEEEWWPILNGKALWVTDEEYWDSDNWAYSTVKLATPGPFRSSSGSFQFRRSPALSTDEAGGNAVLIVDGWDGNSPNPNNDFETDADGMHDALSSVTGIDVTYYGPSEDENPDRDGEASVDAIRRWLEGKAGEMKACETLTLYITSHGGTNFIMVDGERLRANDLRQWLRQFDPGVHIVVILQGCRTGSFTDDLHERSDVTITATNANTSSYFDVDPGWFATWLGLKIEDPNPDDEGSEFTSGLVEDMNEILNDPAKLQQVHDTEERLVKPFWVLFFKYSFATALAKDATAKNSRSFPQQVQRDVGSITLAPSTDENPVSTDHKVTATVRNIDGNRMAGRRVRFTVTGANPTTGTATTDILGEAEFTYHGVNMGEDTIRAKSWAVEATATKNWVAGASASISVDPESATNTAGTSHIVTATVRDQYGHPVPGVIVTFTVTGVNPTSGIGVTDANGQASFSYNGQNAGTDTITAEIDGIQDVAYKTWEAGAPASITVAPENATNPVGTSHTVTATVEDQYGNPVSGAVNFTVTGVNPTTGIEALVNGKARFYYIGENLGTDTITAEIDGLQATAYKTWEAGAPASITLDPEQATNTVGTSHTVTATVLDQYGHRVPGVKVTFTVAGANPTSGIGVTDANGQASFSYNGQNAGTDTITAVADGVQGTGYKTWEAGPPASVILDPEAATNLVGASHTVTATVLDDFGNPVSGVTVNFAVSGANSTGGSSTTDANGKATFSYTGQNAGMDSITANVAELKTAGARKYWLAEAPGSIVLYPADATNPVGTGHAVTATVLDSNGNSMADVAVNFTVTGANSATDSSVTNANGQTSFSYSGQKAGTDTITAEAAGVRGTAAKTWVAGAPADITLDPENATNTVGTSHIVTATVKDQYANPVSGSTVKFTVTGANSTSGSGVTDANGQASFSYSGENLGTDTITAEIDGLQATATKTWEVGTPASITLDPGEATNPVGTSHTVTATVKDQAGNPVSGVVNFTVTGVNPTSGIEALLNGETSFYYTGENAGTDTITAEIDGLQATAYKTWVGPPASITLDPGEATNPIGTSHTVTATVKDQAGNPVSGVVRFTVTGVNPTSGIEALLDGVTSFSYSGENTGTDTITAEIDGLKATAYKTWEAGPPAVTLLDPRDATNPVGTQHTVTATVLDERGNPVSGATVRFTVTGANSTSGSGVTGLNGQASFSYNGQNAGTDTIKAEIEGVEALATKDEVFKNWVAVVVGSISLDPGSATNPVGTEHTVTATVLCCHGLPLPGLTVYFSVTGDNSAIGSSMTDDNGNTKFSYYGRNAGNDIITAEIAGFQSTATKTWVAQ